MNRLLGCGCARLRDLFKLLVFALFLGSPLLHADDDGDYYEDNEVTHRRFENALIGFASPSEEYKGLGDEELKSLFSGYTSVLRRYRFLEVAERVKDALLGEIKHIDSAASSSELSTETIRFWFFHEAFEILNRVGTLDDKKDVEYLVEEIKDKAKFLSKDISKVPVEFTQEVERFVKEADSLVKVLSTRASTDRASARGKDLSFQLFRGRDFLKGRKPDFLNTSARISNFESARQQKLKWIATVEERMTKKAKGQPEAVKGFLSLEYDRVMGPPRVLPEVIWLLGIPGSGKDTHVEAYVDAIHGYEGASKDHVFELKPARSENDAWKFFGSNTGFVGSDRLSPLIKFLVEHSGGKYAVEKVRSFGREIEQVTLASKHDPEKTPDSAVLFVNELHNWSREAIDIILKVVLEKGKFPINNAAGGLEYIDVPVTIVIASNDAMELVRPEGHTRGRKLRYDEVLEMWENVHKDKDRIKRAIQDKNTIRHGKVRDTSAGISDEVLDRIPKSRLFLMRPLSPEDLRHIAQNYLKKLSEDLRHGDNVLGDTAFRFTDRVAEKIQEFQYNAEEGARPLQDRVNDLVKSVVTEAIREEKIAHSSRARVINVDIIENEDKTWSLTFQELDAKTETPLADLKTIPLEATEIFKPKPPMSDEEILRIQNFEESLKEGIVGADKMAPQLKKALLSAENSRHADKSARARRFLMLGLSSTGKTQTAKEMAKFIYGDEGDLVAIDFNGITSEAEVRHMIYGVPGGQKSPFMEAYDRKRGKLLILFDEIANVAHPNILTPLYQLLDEKVIDGFNDKEPRSMEGVTVVMTGNAGEEIFRDIPRHVPRQVQRAAMAEIYRKFMADRQMRRSFLERKFRQAFLNRIGDKNTFFFSPLDFKGVRELIQIKLKSALKTISAENGRNYDVVFQDEASYQKALDVFEKEGFDLWEQGRSIDRFVSEEFPEELVDLLQNALVPSESKVTIEYFERETTGQWEDERSFEKFHVWVEGREEPLVLTLHGQEDDTEALTRYQDKIQTAYHEAGHEILREALMGDLTDPQKISIIPGIAEIGGRFVYYDGVAVHRDLVDGRMTRSYLIARMAQLIAGGEAQRIINRGHINDAGQSNDLERANRAALVMILRFGLDKEWGFVVPSPDLTLDEYIKSLSPESQRRLERLVSGYLKQAQKLAREVLAINYDAFVRLGVTLAKKGELNAQEIKAIYAETPVQEYWKMNWIRRKTKSLNVPFLRTWTEGLLTSTKRNMEMVSSMPKIKENEMANLNKILEARRQEAIKQAKPMSEPPVAGEAHSNCRALVLKANSAA